MRTVRGDTVCDLCAVQSGRLALISSRLVGLHSSPRPHACVGSAGSLRDIYIYGLNSKRRLNVLRLAKSFPLSCL